MARMHSQKEKMSSLPSKTTESSTATQKMNSKTSISQTTKLFVVQRSARRRQRHSTRVTMMKSLKRVPDPEWARNGACSASMMMMISWRALEVVMDSDLVGRGRGRG
jgi:hypothetical protein